MTGHVQDEYNILIYNGYIEVEWNISFKPNSNNRKNARVQRTPYRFGYTNVFKC